MHHYVLLISIMMGNDRTFIFFLHVFSFGFYRLDDLLVGAPLYTVKKDGRIIPDAGRVDIFYQTSEVCFVSLKNIVCLY